MRGHGQPDQYDQMKAMSEQFESDHLAGELEACARVIDYWGGAGSFAAMPEPLRDYCRSVAGTNAHDWRAGWAVDAGKADYARLTMPILIGRGEQAVPGMITMTDALAGCLPDVRRSAVVAGANHFLINSHPDACPELLGAFLAAN
jgi:pimeloyl-ACP methyl ester carboxylesterase